LTRKAGRPLRYGALLEPLQPDKLYAVATIVEEGVRGGILTRAPFNSDPLVAARGKARDALRKLRKHLPEEPDGELAIRPGIRAPAWFGFRWRAIVKAKQQSASPPPDRSVRGRLAAWVRRLDPAVAVATVVLVISLALLTFDGVTSWLRHIRLEENRDQIRAILDRNAFEKIAPDLRERRVRKGYFATEIDPIGRAERVQWFITMKRIGKAGDQDHPFTHVRSNGGMP